MSSSSLSSRMSAASGVSPGWSLRPGNSHNPAIGLPAGRCARSTRPSASMSATQTTVTGAGSAPVAAIDVDVAMRQVAGPHRGAAAAEADVDGDVDVAPGHVARDRRFVIARHGLAALVEGDAADRDRERVAIGLLAGLADGHDDAAPIGVAGCKSCFDEGRIADRE